MPNLTPTYGWQQPLVNDPIDSDLWGGELNSNLAAQDTLLSTVGITPAGALAVKSTNFTIVDGTDATKVAEFDTSAITTATTRTLAVQDVSGTVYVSGGEPVAVADGGTGVATIAAAQASLGIFQHSVVISSSGTFTPAAGVSLVYVEAWGAGAGAGGVSNANNFNSAGGGAGGYTAGFVTVTPSTACTVTIGVGGAGGLTTPSSGTAGGTTSFDGPSLTLTATGGSGGVAGTAFNVTQVGGAGGTGSGGTINLTGQPGENSVSNSSAGTYSGGSGGSAPRGGGGGRAIGTFGTSPGSAGQVPGGGGGGSYRNLAGGAGANGLVIVYYP